MSPDPAETSALVANCMACGGGIPLRVLDLERRCPYCDAEESLAPKVAERVARLRSALLDRSAREQQLVGGQQRLSPSLPLVVIAVLWTLVCGVHLAIFNEGFAGLPGPEFFLSEAPSGGDEVGYSARRGLWWIVYINVTGVAVSAFLGAWSGLIAARVIVEALEPLPPLRDDQPPRCRMCGADLPAGGRIRRCEHCGSDHLLSGAVYRARAASLEESLERLEEELGRTVKARQEALERAAMCPLLLPLPLVLVGWAVPFLPPAPVAVWGLPALAALGYLVVTARTLLLPRFVHEAGAYRPLPGDGVQLGESRLRAWAELELLSEGAEPTLRFLIVGAENPRLETAGPAAQWALLLDWVPGDPARAIRYRVDTAEAPLDEGRVRGARLHLAPGSKGKRRAPLHVSARIGPGAGVPVPGEEDAMAPGVLWVSAPDAAPLPRELLLREPTRLPDGAVALAKVARRPTP